MDTTDAPQIIEHIHKSVNYTPYDVKWVPCSARFVSMGILPNAKGVIQVNICHCLDKAFICIQYLRWLYTFCMNRYFS